MKLLILFTATLSLSGCSAIGGLRTDLSAQRLATDDTEKALTEVLLEAFDENNAGRRTFKRDPKPEDITRFVNAGFTLTDIYCDVFFRNTNLSFRKRKFGRGATNDVGTVITGILGLASTGPKVISGVATGFGLADSSWRNYDESFVVSPELDVVRSLVLSAQDQFRRATIDNIPTDYMTARSAVIRYAGLCSFLGMQALLNQSVDQQRRQLQEAARGNGVGGSSGTPDAVAGVVPAG